MEAQDREVYRLTNSKLRKTKEVKEVCSCECKECIDGNCDDCSCKCCDCDGCDCNNKFELGYD